MDLDMIVDSRCAIPVDEDSVRCFIYHTHSKNLFLTVFVEKNPPD